MRKYIKKKFLDVVPEVASTLARVFKTNPSTFGYDPTDVFIHFLFEIDEMNIHSSSINALYMLTVCPEKAVHHWNSAIPFPTSNQNLVIECNSVKTLKSFTHVNREDDLELFKTIFPKITSLHINVESGDIQHIRRNWPNLKELYFSAEDGVSYSNNELSRFFFDGRSFGQMQEDFIADVSPKLSFKNLRRLSMSINTKHNNEFLSMFLYYYQNLDFQCDQVVEDKCVTTAFNGYICHNVSLNPGLSLSHCDIRVEDLKMSYTADVLKSWVNLDSICFIITSMGKSLDLDDIMNNFESILKGCSKLQSLQVMNIANMNIKSILSLMRQKLLRADHKIVKLSIVDDQQQTTLDVLLDFIFCFPKLTHLKLSGQWKKHQSDVLLIQSKCFLDHLIQFHSIIKCPK